MIDKSIFFDLAFSLYPKTDSSFINEIDQSPEMIALKNKVIQLRLQSAINWEKLKNSIETKFSRDVTDNTNAIIQCGCFYCSFSISANYLAKIHVWISVLIPHFIVEIDWYDKNNLKTEEISLIEERTFSLLNTLIFSHFEVSPFPEELQKVEVENIILERKLNKHPTFRELFFTEWIARY